jgi:hypothetical protein
VKDGYLFLVRTRWKAENENIQKSPNTKHKKSPSQSIDCEGLSSRDPGGILTLDLQNRNLTLYTAKLRSLKNDAKLRKKQRRTKLFQKINPQNKNYHIDTKNTLSASTLTKIRYLCRTF